jgi:hypothetical protein
MSRTDATRLLAALKTDSALRDRFKRAGNAGFDALAAKEGFAVTRVEFADVIRETSVTEQRIKADGFAVMDGIVVSSTTAVI